MDLTETQISQLKVDNWIGGIYNTCNTVLYQLQEKENLTEDENGLRNLCEAVVYLYDKTYIPSPGEVVYH